MGFGRDSSPLKFRRFFRHLEAIDDILLEYADRHGLGYSRNHMRLPDRQLHIVGNPEIHIIVFLDEAWGDANAISKLPVNPDDLQHSVGVVGYYQDNVDRANVDEVGVSEQSRSVGNQRYKRREVVIAKRLFPDLVSNLIEYLDEARYRAMAWPLPNAGETEAKKSGWERTEYWFD